MPVNLVVSQLGESVVEATVGHWRKAEGDFVNPGEVVVELETDKVDLEVGATHAGVLTRIERSEGQTVKIGDVLAVIAEAAPGPDAGPEKPRETPTVPPERTPAKETPSPAPRTMPGPEPTATPRSTPSARRLALEKGVDLRQVPASDEGAPITPADVEGYADAGEDRTEAALAAGAPSMVPAAPVEEAPGEERIRMSRRRLTIATRLVEALRTAAMVTTFNDVDMSAVLELRRRHQDSFRQRYGVSLGIVSFFIKAAIPALRTFPRLNAEIQGDEMVLKHHYDIGMAVGAAEGLVVPVLRNADRMSFGALEQAIKSFARKTEDGTLTLDDLRGGTFTISNGGVFGSLLSAPILNPPQVGILGLHRIEERPVSFAGEIRIRPMMYLALSYDHRIVDGLEAVRFLKRIKELVEHPEDLFLES
ncbi:MAG: 2-oxoglutarate dehydrogenase complex dihydrolipoyllysine-residue succinyltransferase [Acidobacteriia bacterium]|nr:2-oxoglutarate dehydrogenase complex dihydrolipoyllysine-residue succinyltransferase [Terriglobia bacterium]